MPPDPAHAKSEVVLLCIFRLVADLLEKGEFIKAIKVKYGIKDEM